MRAILKLECIGGEYPMPLGNYQMNKLFIERYRDRPRDWPVPHKYWAAEVSGIDIKGDLTKTFLNGKKSYAESNGRGTRGVYIFYTLDDGHLYEISEPVSWNRYVHYFCRVSAEGEIIRMSKEEAFAWLKSRSGLTSLKLLASE